MKYNDIIVAFTGAGISKSAGIPTFQDVPDVSEKLSVDYKKSNPQDFEAVMDTLKKNCSGKLPTPAHIALAKYKVPIITMNIDGLHQASMQTQFANYLSGMAQYYAELSVEFINEDADTKVQQFLENAKLDLQETFYNEVQNDN